MSFLALFVSLAFSVTASASFESCRVPVWGQGSITVLLWLNPSSILTIQGPVATARKVLHCKRCAHRAVCFLLVPLLRLMSVPTAVCAHTGHCPHQVSDRHGRRKHRLWVTVSKTSYQSYIFLLSLLSALHGPASTMENPYYFFLMKVTNYSNTLSISLTCWSWLVFVNLT